MMNLPTRYELIGTNNSGGMGDILYCKDNHLQRKVVIKVLKKDIEKERLIDEQLSLINLRSKHVVQLYDVINMGQQIGLVLEYIEGQDLGVGTYKSDMIGLEKILWQISCGLSDIHKAGIIHRDIKPSNIRRDQSGVIKVFDFGLSRTLDEARTHSVIGSICYMAPELWKRGEIKFTSAVDVYAFGITAMALTDAVIPDAFTTCPPSRQPNRNWMRVSLPALDVEICEILERCLEYDPKDRPDISDVELSLRRHLLKDKHKGLLVMGSQVKVLNRLNRGAKITSMRNGELNGEIAIRYDGYDFIITNCAGNVYVNNKIVNNGDLMPEASVITLGSGPKRGFVTFDISNPEVVS